VVLKGEHAAIRVIDDDEFFRAQQMVGDDQRSQRVFTGDATGIAYDVGLQSSIPETAPL
jgi:hypothetical protein